MEFTVKVENRLTLYFGQYKAILYFGQYKAIP